MNRSKSWRNLWHFPDGHFETRVNRAGLIETTQSHWCAVKSTGDPTLILFLAICPTHTQRNNYNLNFSSRGQAADLIHYTLGLALPVTNDIIVENPLIANEWRGGKMMMGGDLFLHIHLIHDFSVDIKGLLFMIIAALKKSGRELVHFHSRGISDLQRVLAFQTPQKTGKEIEKLRRWGLFIFLMKGWRIYFSTPPLLGFGAGKARPTHMVLWGGERFSPITEKG